MVKIYCKSCKKNREILNGELKEVPTKKRIVRFYVGECEICGSKISRIIPNDFKVPEEVSNEIVISPEEFRREDIPILEEIKNNRMLNKIAREEGIYVGSSLWHGFLFSITLISIIIFLIMIPILIYGGYLKSSVNTNLACGNLSTVCDNNCPICPSCNCPTITIPDCPQVNCNCNVNSS